MAWVRRSSRDAKKKPLESGFFPLGLMAAHHKNRNAVLFFRYAMKPTPKKPRIIIAQVEGSGTAALRDNCLRSILEVTFRTGRASTILLAELVASGPVDEVGEPAHTAAYQIKTVLIAGLRFFSKELLDSFAGRWAAEKDSLHGN
jgi:hypothetical protein